MKYSNYRRFGQRGMTLVEILVAVAILAIVMVVVLSIYDLSRKSFKKGENITEQQQAVRIAFDQMVADLRTTGLNYNPDGSKARPDEQFEAAYDTAIVVRGDFDAEDPVDSLTPESTLGGTTFVTVSTGNDEIYTYALAKSDGSSTDTMTFDVDVQQATRDGVVETVTIPNVAMVHDDPPYTLYRITLNNDTSTWGTSSFITRTPLIDNVYSMSFRYYDQAGMQSNNTFDLTSIAEDIGGDDGGAAEVIRDGIRRVSVELVGLTPEPDMNWVDENDPYAATEAHRKFTLAGDISPRNIGMVGIKDINTDVTPPGQPATPSLVMGHCGGIYMSWAANPSADEVAYYRVNIGTTSGSYNQSRSVMGLETYVSSLADGTTYYVALQAVDASGNQSVYSSEASGTTSNVNTPSVPVNLVVTTTLNGVVDMTWDQVATNSASQPSGDPQAPAIRDLAGYRVFRSTVDNFSHHDTVMVADENTTGDREHPSYADSSVVNCRTYYYWVQAVDACGQASSESSGGSGNSLSDDNPEAPQNAQAFFAGTDEVALVWTPVEHDVTGRDIFIDTYKVYRSALVPVSAEPSIPTTFAFIGTATGESTYRDPIFIPDGYTVYYQISAIDDCGNESAGSDAVNPDCAFSGTVVFLNPVHDQPVSGVVEVQITVTDTVDTFDQLILEFHPELGGTPTDVVLEDPGPTWQYNWLADPPGPYTIVATVVNSEGCSKTESIHVSAGFDVGCCLSPPNPELDPIVLSCDGGGSSKCKIVSYEIINNNCLTAVAIEEMDITWVDNTNDVPLLTGVQFDGIPIWNVSPAENTPASVTFSDPRPAIDISRDNTNPVYVTYTYTENMSKRVGRSGSLRNTLTSSYTFRLLNETGDPTGITGVCGPATGMFQNMIVE